MRRLFGFTVEILATVALITLSKAATRIMVMPIAAVALVNDYLGATNDQLQS